MVIHSSILAWKTPWMEEPVGYSSSGREESDTTELLHFTLQLAILGLFSHQRSNVIYHPEMLSSVQFSCSVVSDSLPPHGLQHARPPCPSPTPGVYSDLGPLSQSCHPTISSSVIPFSSHRQSFLATESFQMSQLFASGGQSVGVSASASVLPTNTQD